VKPGKGGGGRPVKRYKRKGGKAPLREEKSRIVEKFSSVDPRRSRAEGMLNRNSIQKWKEKKRKGALLQGGKGQGREEKRGPLVNSFWEDLLVELRRGGERLLIVLREGSQK